MTTATRTTSTRTAYRGCPLCEAGCGLEITLRREAGSEPWDEEVVRIRGDRDDVFSHGFICPKGSTLKQLHEDPDRVRTPLVRRDGELVPATWDEAFAEIERRLLPIVEEHGRDAVGVYLGNPNVHNVGGLLYGRVLLKALGTGNLFSASTVDQRPKEISAGLMFGHQLSVPVPDLDRTDHLLLLGANPWASNGSLATAPDWPGRLDGIRARGGAVVVVDPRRTRTAEAATEHLAIVPGTDAHLLFAIVHTLFDEDLVDLGPLAELVEGLDEVERLARLHPRGRRANVRDRRRPRSAASPASSPRAERPSCTGGSARARRSSARSRTGSSTSATCSPATSTGPVARCSHVPRSAPPTRAARRVWAGACSSRVERAACAGCPSRSGSCRSCAWRRRSRHPVRARSARSSRSPATRCSRSRTAPHSTHALAGLDFMVSFDIYVNETTRHADVILPSASPLAKSHYDLALLQLAVRNVANYSPPVLPLDPDELDDWVVLAKLALVAQGLGAGADPALVDDLAIRSLVDSAVGDEHSPDPRA